MYDLAMKRTWVVGQKGAAGPDRGTGHRWLAAAPPRAVTMTADEAGGILVDGAHPIDVLCKAEPAGASAFLSRRTLAMERIDAGHGEDGMIRARAEPPLEGVDYAELNAMGRRQGGSPCADRDWCPAGVEAAGMQVSVA